MIRRLCRLATLALSLGYFALGTTACTSATCAEVGMCAAGPGTDIDAGDEESSSVTATLVNRYDAPYPTENQGWTMGGVAPNVLFEHLLEKRKLNAPLTLRHGSLAEFYDPEVRDWDVIVLVLATEWDANSMPMLDKLGAAPRKTVVLTVLGQSGSGIPPTLDEDFPRWANRYPWAWHVLDPNFTAFAALRGPDVPILAVIDARTMEISYLKKGATMGDASSIEGEIAKIRARYP